MDHHLRNNGAALHNAGVRCKVALKNRDAAVRHIWIVDRTDNFRIQINSILDVLGHGLSGDRRNIQCEKVLLRKFLHDCIDAACLIQIFHVCRACRCEMAQVRCLRGNLVCDFHIDLDACLMCNCRQMKHCICRAAESHVDRQSIHKRFTGHDISRKNLVLYKVHDLVSGVLGKTDSGGIYGRNRSVAAKAHADGFREAVHRVCGVHAGAGTACRADILLEIAKFFRIDLACVICADRLEHG